MTKICIISDTHNNHDKIQIPECDFLIHTGDATNRGTIPETSRFLTWFGKQPAKYKLFTPGNHDWLFEKNLALASEMCIQNNVELLLHEKKEFEGINFFMSPYTPEFNSWAFNVSLGEKLKELWNFIPNDIDILATHGGPFSILDEIFKSNGNPYDPPQHVGCPDLLKTVQKIKPDIHLFGHLHGCGGQEKHIDGISFYNVAICDDLYMPTNPIRIIEYSKE